MKAKTAVPWKDSPQTYSAKLFHRGTRLLEQLRASATVSDAFSVACSAIRDIAPSACVNLWMLDSGNDCICLAHSSIPTGPKAGNHVRHDWLHGSDHELRLLFEQENSCDWIPVEVMHNEKPLACSPSAGIAYLRLQTQDDIPILLTACVPKGLEGDYSELPGYFQMLGHGLLQAIERIRIQSGHQLLSEIAGLAVGQRTPQQFFNDVAHKVAAAFGAIGCSIFVYDEFRDSLALGGTTGLYRLPSEAVEPESEQQLTTTELADLSYERGEGLTGWIFEKHKLVRLYDALSSSECERKFGVPPSFKSAEWPEVRPRTFLGAPIFFDGKFVGVIRLHGKPDTGDDSNRSLYFLPSDEKKLEAVSEVLGRSMHQWVSEFSVRDWASDNDHLLLNLQHLLDGEHDLRASLLTIAEQAKKLLSGCAASILVVSSDQKTLTVEAEACNRQLTKEKLVIDISTGICGAAVTNRKVWAEPDTQAADSLFADLSDQIPNGISDVLSEAAAPIILGGQVVGVLNVDSDSKGWFTPEDPKLRILERLASQAALVICREQDDAAAVSNLSARALAHQFKDDLGAFLLILSRLSVPKNTDPGHPIRRSVKKLREFAKDRASFWDAVADLPAFDDHQLRTMYLNDVIDQANYVFEPIQSLDNVKLELKFCNELWEGGDEAKQVQIDVLHVHLILSNLLSNAVEAIQENGKVTVETSISDGNAVLSVSDSGEGIEPELQNVIFQKYVSTKGRKGKGCILVNRMVKAHGGQVKHSRTKTGETRISVSIPIFENEI